MRDPRLEHVRLARKVHGLAAWVTCHAGGTAREALRYYAVDLRSQIEGAERALRGASPSDRETVEASLRASARTVEDLLEELDAPAEPPPPALKRGEMAASRV